MATWWGIDPTRTAAPFLLEDPGEDVAALRPGRQRHAHPHRRRRFGGHARAAAVRSVDEPGPRARLAHRGRLLLPPHHVVPAGAASRGGFELRIARRSRRHHLARGRGRPVRPPHRRGCLRRRHPGHRLRRRPLAGGGARNGLGHPALARSADACMAATIEALPRLGAPRGSAGRGSPPTPRPTWPGAGVPPTTGSTTGGATVGSCRAAPPPKPRNPHGPEGDTRRTGSARASRRSS